LDLIAPARQKTRNVNAELQKHAHWTRTHILDEEFPKASSPRLFGSRTRSYTTCAVVMRYAVARMRANAGSHDEAANAVYDLVLEPNNRGELALGKFLVEDVSSSPVRMFLQLCVDVARLLPRGAISPMTA